MRNKADFSIVNLLLPKQSMIQLITSLCVFSTDYGKDSRKIFSFTEAYFLTDTRIL